MPLLPLLHTTIPYEHHTPRSSLNPLYIGTFTFIDAGRQMANATAAATEEGGRGGGEEGDAVHEENDELCIPGGAQSGSIVDRLGPSSQSTSERAGANSVSCVHACMHACLCTCAYMHACVTRPFLSPFTPY